jgi:hypothetical protein
VRQRSAVILKGRPAMLAFDRHDAGQWPAYFVLDLRTERLWGIRDFHFARYALDGAQQTRVGSAEPVTLGLAMRSRLP